jgi:hypothetical protein
VFQLPLWRADIASLWQAVAPIIFLNQLWLWPVGPGSNGPFWSIGYEAWYYIDFGLVLFLRGWVRLFGVIAAAALVGPSILGRGRSSMLAWAIWATTLLVIAAFYLIKYKIMNLFCYIVFGTAAHSQQFEYFFPCISVAILFAVNVVCFDRIGPNFALSEIAWNQASGFWLREHFRSICIKHHCCFSLVPAVLVLAWRPCELPSSISARSHPYSCLLRLVNGASGH